MTDIEPHVHDVHVLNLVFLSTIQKTCNEDAVRASALFGLSTKEVDVIKSLSIEAVHSLAFGIHESLALLRFSAQDIAAISKAPAPIQSLYAAVHGPGYERQQLAA